MLFRSLALGAHGVLLGRAWAYALAARGRAGVLRLLDIIEHEMRVAMALTACTTIESIDRSVLANRVPRDIASSRSALGSAVPGAEAK